MFEFLSISEYRFTPTNEPSLEGGKRWVSEASTLEFAPGRWPHVFVVVPVVGEPRRFESVGVLQDGGRRYRSGNDIIDVLND